MSKESAKLRVQPPAVQAPPLRILVVSGHDPRSPVCGVFDHAQMLTAELRSRSHKVVFVEPRQLDLVAGSWDAVHLHYVPFLYSDWGLGGLPLARLVRRLLRLGSLVLTVHEPRVRYGLNPRGIIMAGVQDLTLQVLCRVASEVIVPTSGWLPFLRGHRARVVPAGSTLPPRSPRHRPAHRSPIRVGLMANPGNPGRMSGLSVRTAQVLQERVGAHILGLGPGPGQGFEHAGYLPPAEFAAALAGCDLVLMPFLDGASGRRTSLISALQVGVPTLTTLLPPMADFTYQGAFEHTLPDDEEGFIRLALMLAGNPGRRAELAQAAAARFEAELSWPVLGSRFEAVYV